MCELNPAVVKALSSLNPPPVPHSVLIQNFDDLADMFTANDYWIIAEDNTLFCEINIACDNYAEVGSVSKSYRDDDFVPFLLRRNAGENKFVVVCTKCNNWLARSYA